MGNAQPPVLHCDHHGAAPVEVGPYQIYLGGAYNFRPGDIEGFDLLIPLASNAVVPFRFGNRYSILAAPLIDFGGVPPRWRDFLEVVIKELQQGKKILAYCLASHGRSGLLAASLIALLEAKDETPDPIEAIRKRHCSHAVESYAQAEAIFSLRNDPVPALYQPEPTAVQKLVPIKKFRKRSSKK